MVTLTDISKAFEKKTTSFLTLGIILLIFSMYFNTIKENSSDIGIQISIIIIALALIAQIANWMIFWHEKYKKLNA